MSDERPDILRRELARMQGNLRYEFDAIKGSLLVELGKLQQRHTDELDALSALFDSEGFRVVSADAVVINRDDIPRGAESVYVNEAQLCRWSGREVEAKQWEQMARLLSGGSPAATQEERCPTCRVDDRAHLAGTVVNDFEVCRDPWHAGSPAAPEDGEPR